MKLWFFQTSMLPLAQDEVFTVDEVAAMLKLSRWSVIRKFADEPGVVDMGSPYTTRRSRRYRVLRIPMSVINRVLARRRK